VQTGRNGYLFEPGNAEMLSEQARRVFSDRELRDRLGQGSLRVIKDHAVERTMEKFETFYSAAVRQRAPVWPYPAANGSRRLIPSFLR
jgi:glycosyltransferase involved in cell wall biosynthesis